MNLEDVIKSGKVDFSGIPANYYLIGLLSAFENRFQAMADSTMQRLAGSSSLQSSVSTCVPSHQH